MALAFQLVLVTALQAVNRVPRVGDLAPPLRPAVTVQGHFEPQFYGRATLIEFWAASCSPCVAGIGHLNELADRFSGQPLDFVSVNTYESIETIRAFLKIHPMRGVVLADNGEEMTRAYGVQAIPVTVLIAPNGRLAAIGHPSQVTPEVLDQVLANKPVQLASSGYGLTVAVPRRHSLVSTKDSISLDPYSLVRVAILPTSESGANVSSSDQFESKGATLRSLLSFAYDMPPSQVSIPSGLEQERYAVQVWVPPDSANTLKPIMQAAIAAAAAVRVRLEVRTLPVLAIEGLPGKLIPSRNGSPVSRCADGTGEISAEGSDLEFLRSCIELITGKSVIISKPISKPVVGTYRFEIRWTLTQSGAFQAALRDQLGLQLLPQKASLNVLVVEPLGGSHTR